MADHLVMLLKLDRDDLYYRAPWNCRFVVEQVDGDRHYFLARGRAEQFTREHGLTPVDAAAMAEERSRLFPADG